MNFQIILYCHSPARAFIPCVVLLDDMEYSWAEADEKGRAITRYLNAKMSENGISGNCHHLLRQNGDDTIAYFIRHGYVFHTRNNIRPTHV